METQKSAPSSYDGRNYTVLNELCTDGVYRPVWICPTHVTNIRKLDYPITDVHCAKTCVSYKEPDTFAGYGACFEVNVFESMPEVLAALGSTMAATYIYSANFFHAEKDFTKLGIKYSHKRPQPPANES